MKELSGNPYCSCKQDFACITRDLSEEKKPVKKLGCGTDNQDLQGYHPDDCWKKKSGKMRCPSCVKDAKMLLRIVDLMGN